MLSECVKSITIQNLLINGDARNNQKITNLKKTLHILRRGRKFQFFSLHSKDTFFRLTIGKWRESTHYRAKTWSFELVNIWPLTQANAIIVMSSHFVNSYLSDCGLVGERKTIAQHIHEWGPTNFIFYSNQSKPLH